MQKYEYKVKFLDGSFIDGTAILELNELGDMRWKAVKADGYFYYFMRAMDDDNKKYEYRCFKCNGDVENTEGELCALGKEGWEVYASLGSWLRMRREKPFIQKLKSKWLWWGNKDV
jgi:hypothetical protein